MHTPSRPDRAGRESAPALRLLIADDNDLDALKITRAIASLDVPHVVSRAHDGLEALEAMRTDPSPTLVLLDLQMPRMNGFELLEARDRDPSLWHIPILVLSTSTRQLDVDRCYRSRIAGYLVKPASVPDMQQLIAITVTFWSRCQPGGAVLPARQEGTSP